MRQYFYHLGTILIVKIIAIFLIHSCFFSKEHRQKVTPTRIYDHLIGSP